MCLQVFTLKLIQQLAATGHRTLVFAQSLGMLDMLQRALRRYASYLCILGEPSFCI